MRAVFHDGIVKKFHSFCQHDLDVVACVEWEGRIEYIKAIDVVFIRSEYEVFCDSLQKLCREFEREKNIDSFLADLSILQYTGGENDD